MAWRPGTVMRVALLGMHLFVGGEAAAEGATDSGAHTPSLRIGGGFDLGMTLRRQSGAFDWDVDSARDDTSLARLKIELTPAPGLRGFVRFGARRDPDSDPEAPELRLQEAAIVYRRDLDAGRTLALRAFARQPGEVWLDLPLHLPIAVAPRTQADLQGVRATVAGRRWTILGLAADLGRGDPAARDGDVFATRIRADLAGGRVRVGGTFVRQIPAASLPASARAVIPERTEVWSGDLRVHLRPVLLQLQYDQVDPPPAVLDSRVGFVWTRSRRLTDVLPTTAALRCEARVTEVPVRTWGWLGIVPAYRAIGKHYDVPLAAAEPDAGHPRRGLEGYRWEAWFRAAHWPIWARQVYDRVTVFADADRRILRQVSEVQAFWARGLRSRVVYVQRQVHEPARRHDEHASTLLAELAGDDSRTRLRVQYGLLDVDSPQRSDVLVLETATSLTSRWRLLLRGSVRRQASQVRHAFFAELVAWQLPRFEMALGWGRENVGDAADPTLDADLLSMHDADDHVRLRFRGWF